MGTRADFYVGKGKDAEWLGSISFDGHPDCRGPQILEAGVSSEKEYRNSVKMLIADEGHGTTPEQGWPWPWDDSGTTDFSYTYIPETGDVLFVSFGYAPWWPVIDQENAPRSGENGKVTFPNMKDKANVAPPGSKRSGMMMFKLKK